MVEVIRRPHKPNLFVQVSVAVISGAAAMYCIQNLKVSSVPPAPAARAPAPVETKAPEAQPVEPPPALPDPSIERARFKLDAPAPSSMMIVAEEGGGDKGIVGVGSDEPIPPARDAGSALAKKAKAAAPAAKAAPAFHLQQSGLHSPYSGQIIGHGFASPPMQAKLFAKKEAPQAPEEAAPAPAKARPVALISGPRIINEKQIPQKDIFVPSLLHPELVPDQPFWDPDLKRKTVLAGLIAAAGLGYLLLGMGFFASVIGKPRE
jgi:hypothetical protein